MDGEGPFQSDWVFMRFSSCSNKQSSPQCRRGQQETQPHGGGGFSPQRSWPISHRIVRQGEEPSRALTTWPESRGVFALPKRKPLPVKSNQLHLSPPWPFLFSLKVISLLSVITVSQQQGGQFCLALVVFPSMNDGRQFLIFLPLNEARIFNYPLILCNTLILCYMIAFLALKSFVLYCTVIILLWKSACFHLIIVPHYPGPAAGGTSDF